jgi:hypothetical protein
MKVTAWKGGRFENPSIAYGIRIGERNRDRHFRREWTTVTVEIDGGSTTEVELSGGFWRACPEIRHPAFRAWLSASDLIPWPAGRPPVFKLIPVSGNRFRLSRHHER